MYDYTSNLHCLYVDVQISWAASKMLIMHQRLRSSNDIYFEIISLNVNQVKGRKNNEVVEGNCLVF